MMMKFSFISVVSAAVVLSSCASIQNPHSNDDVVHGEKYDNTDGSNHPDYGEPTRHADMRVEERELTSEIALALDVPDAVSVLAFDLNGNPIRFTSQKPGLSNTDIVYPFKASRIGNVYTTTYVWFDGSHCVVITDNWGDSFRICS